MKTIFELVKEGRLEEIKEVIKSDKALLKSKDFNKRNLIMLASERGDEEVFNYLLTQKAPFKGSDSDKNTALHYAMKASNFEIIKTLVNKKIKVEQLNKKQEPAIILINKKTTPEIIELLLEKHDLNEIYDTDSYKGNLLYFIAMEGNLELLKFILDKGIKSYNDNYFYRAVEDNSVEKAKYLISKGFDSKLTDKQLIKLFQRSNDFEVIKFLIEEVKIDASKNIIIDSFGELNTLQHYIDEYYLSDDEKLKIVKLLVDNGADINYLDYGKRDAMYYAIKNNNIEIVKLLLNLDSSLEKMSEYLLKFTSYHYKELKESIRISTIRFILDNVKNIDLKILKNKLLEAMKKDTKMLDNFLKWDSIDDLKYFINTFELDIQEEYFEEWSLKYSFFTRAIYLNQIDKVKFFLGMDADVNQLDIKGYSPVYYALDTNEESVLDLLNLLVENGVDLKIKIGKKKQGLLLTALLKGGYYSSKFLLEQGVTLGLPVNNFFKMKTYSNGDIDIPSFKIIKLLIDNGLDLDISDTRLLGHLLLSVSKNTDNLLYLLNKYNMDLNTLDLYYLRKILVKIVNNDELTAEENFINLKKLKSDFNLNALSDDIKSELVKQSVKNIEIFKLFEEEFEFKLSDEDTLKQILENIINSKAVDTLKYILLKDDVLIYDIYDTYKDTLRLAKKRNKDRDYLNGFEERAQNLSEITDILKKYDKEMQKKIEKGEITEKEEVEQSEEDKIIEKLDAPWIDLNTLPELSFKNGEKISAKITLMLLSAVKNFGYQSVLEQIQSMTKKSILELFKYLRNEVSREMWIYDLLFALAEDDTTIYPLIEENIERYGYSGGYHLQNQLINKLVEIKNIEGLKFIYKLMKSKRNSIKNSAFKAFRTKSYLLGVTQEELKDMLISDFGLDSNRELVLDYGTRKITVKLLPDFKLKFTDKSINKEYKSLPKATKSDDEEKVKEATLFIKKMKKELKKIISDMKARLNSQFIDPKFNKFSYWEQLFVKNPVLNIFATNLFWGVYKNEKLEKVFIYTTDGSYLDIEQNEITLNKDDLISIVHPIDLAEDNLQKAKDFIDDYEIIQPIIQINRQFFKPSDKNSKKLMDFNGKTVKGNTFHYALTKAGFSKGIVEDNGTIFTYYMDVKNTEVLVVMSGITIGFYDNGDIEIYEIIFRKSKDIELGKVDSRVFSEVYLALSSL